MSFCRAPIRRFNEVDSTCSPPVGSYDPKVEGTIPIPYPKGDSAWLMRRDTWSGSTQSLLTLNLGRLSSSSWSSCHDLANERIATRLHSTGCLGVQSGCRQKALTGRDGGRESGSPAWSFGRAGRAVSEVCVKDIVKANDGDGGVSVKVRPRGQEVKGAHGKCKANDEDSSYEVKPKSRTVIGPEIDRRIRPKTEATDKAKCEDGREASGKTNSKASAEVNAKAHCQATGESIVSYKGISSKHTPPASRTAQHGNDQLQKPSQESIEEWKPDERAVFGGKHKPRSKRRQYRLILPRRDNARQKEEKASQSKKQVQELDTEEPNRRLEHLPSGNNSDLLIDALERVSRAEDEAEALRIRVDELERENAELDQTRVSRERDLIDEVDWRTEELVKAEALLEKTRSAKRRVKQELNNCQALVENLRMENLEKTEELEGSRASVIMLRTLSRRSAEELERALLLIENLRLENSRKEEDLEHFQSLARHLQTEYITVLETLEKSRSLVENLTAELMTKAAELENANAVIGNLQSESNGKSAALENSWLAIENLQLENHRCKEALRHCQPYMDSHLAGDSKLPQWSHQRPVRASNPEKHSTTFQPKPRRSAFDEDCEMSEASEFKSDRDDARYAIGDESGRCHSKPVGDGSGVEIQLPSDVVQTEFTLVECRSFQSESSEIWRSSSSGQDGFKETQGRQQTRGSLSFCAVESSDDDQQQQKLSIVKSEPIITDELTAICNQIQILSLSKKETGLKTEKVATGGQKELDGNPVAKESEHLKQGEGHRKLEHVKEAQETVTYREPACLEEFHGAIETLEPQIPQNIESSEVGLRVAHQDVESSNSGELLMESSILNLDRVIIEDRNNQSTSADDHPTSRLERLSEDGPKDQTSCQDLVSNNAAGDRKAVETYCEKKCFKSISQLKTSDRDDSRSGTSDNNKKTELKEASADDGGPYRPINVHEKHVENSRERFRPNNTNESRRALQERFLCAATEKRVGKVGEKCAQGSGGENLRESGEKKFGKELRETFVKNVVAEKRGVKLGVRSSEKFGEKFQGNVGPEHKFSVSPEYTEVSGDSRDCDDADTATQWRRRYEELWSVAQPFRDMLSAFHSQRQLLQGHRNAGKADIEKLSHDFAKVLNHEHERQRIFQMIQLREQNTTLKRELDFLRRKVGGTEVTRRR